LLCSLTVNSAFSAGSRVYGRHQSYLKIWGHNPLNPQDWRLCFLMI